jgi:hypothetical protein
MFGRSRYTAALSGAKESVWPYADRFFADEKMRRRVFAAVAAGFAAWQRARQLPQLRATAVQLAADPVLRNEVQEMVTQLQKAQERVERGRSHRMRNLLLALSGIGAAVAAWRVSAVRGWLRRLMGKGSDAAESFANSPGPGAAPTPTEENEADAPVRAA